MNLSSIDIVGFLAYFAVVAKPVPAMRVAGRVFDVLCVGVVVLTIALYIVFF